MICVLQVGNVWSGNKLFIIIFENVAVQGEQV